MRLLSNIFRVLRRELQRIYRQPVYLTLMLVLPLVSFGYFAAIFNGGVAHDIPIAVIDQDNTTLSRTLTQMMDATQSAVVAYEAQDMAEGERLMREGRVSAIVLIPSNFEKSILDNVQTCIEVYNSGTNISVNGFLHRDLQTAATTFSTGIQLQLLMKQGLSERQAMAMARPVNFAQHILFNPHVNYGYYLAPVFMPMMILIFTVLLTAFIIGSELKHATAKEWLDTGGGSIFAALVGKTLPTTTVMFLLSLAMYIIVFDIMGAPMNGSMAILLLGTLVFIAAYQAIAVIFVALFANMRLALSIGGGYSVLGFTMSGVTFPLMSMNKSMQIFARIFPFTYFTELYIDQAMRGAPAVYSVRAILAMSIFIIISLAFLPRLKRVCSEEKFWGRL